MVRRRGGSSNAGSFQPSKTGRSGSSPQQGVKANSFQGGQKSSSPVKFNVSSIHKRGPSKLQMRAFQEPEDIEMQDSSLSRTGQKPFYKTTHSISENSVLEFVKDDVEAAHRGAVATYVEISGLPPFPSLKDLLALLKRKSQKPFQTVSKIQFSPGQDMCYLHIKNKAQAAALQAISGISFRDHKVNIKFYG